MEKVLFLCGKNKMRSPTAESIFCDVPGYEVLSAGLNNDANIPASVELIQWADYIFVMEKSHTDKLRRKFKKSLNKQRIICLDIPDDFKYMEEALIRILKSRCGNFFKRI